MADCPQEEQMPIGEVYRTGRLGGWKLQDAQGATPTARSETEGFWPKGWWSIVDYKIGIIPLPVFVILLAVIAGFAFTGKVPSDILMAIVLLSMGGFACAELRSEEHTSELPSLRH